MMIYIDEQVAVRNARSNGAQPFKTGGVGCDHAIEFHAAFWLLNSLCIVQEFVLLRNRIFVPAPDFLAFVLERKREAELRTDTISIGANVAHYAESLALPDALDNPIDNFRVAGHSGTLKSRTGRIKRQIMKWDALITGRSGFFELFDDLEDSIATDHRIVNFESKRGCVL